MPTSTIITQLVERFNQNISSYSASAYNETQLRREFLDPFFEALGWDVPNKQGYAEAYKEVVHEDAIKVGSATKSPDYSFRVGGSRKFFVEAKKPSVNIKDDISPAFQLRRYRGRQNCRFRFSRILKSSRFTIVASSLIKTTRQALAAYFTFATMNTKNAGMRFLRFSQKTRCLKARSTNTRKM